MMLKTRAGIKTRPEQDNVIRTEMLLRRECMRCPEKLQANEFLYCRLCLTELSNKGVTSGELQKDEQG